MSRSASLAIAAELIAVALLLGLTACGKGSVKPIHGVNSTLRQSASSQRAPTLGQDWLVTIANQRGREKIALINLRNGRRPVPLPGLNRADAQPISVSVSADGQRLAVIRQRENQTELLLYRRNTGLSQRLEIIPGGVPRQVSISGNGREIAVQVSRNGRWDVDLIRLPG